MAVRRKAQTQTEAYWCRDFRVRPEDIETIYDLMLEDGRPRPLGELTCEVMERHVRREAQARHPEDAVTYRPREQYPVGQKLYFPRLDNAIGTVVSERPGVNPRYGQFVVISVQLEGEEQPREFAAELSAEHILNDMPDELVGEEETEISPAELCERYGEPVQQALQETLAQNSEFVAYDSLWFLRGLLPEVHVGHLNLAEAVIDVAGHPLSTPEIQQHLELADEARPRAVGFALNMALEKDGRFDNVGTTSEPRWFLYNLEPPAVAAKPARLQPDVLTAGREWLLHRESLEIAEDIGDEIDQFSTGEGEAEVALESGKASFVLSYPHRQEGTFPLTRAVLSLFPSEEYSRIPVHFVDARTDASWAGWVLPNDGYGWGLGDWYAEEGVPSGATVELLMTRDPYTVAVQCDTRSRRSEWVRVPFVENARLTFEIRKRAYTCRYDRNLLLGEPTDTERLDELFRRFHEGKEPKLFDVILELFPELVKLGSQGLVHTKVLYQAVNVVWRTGAVPIFAELSRHACFDPVGDGNWSFDDTLTNAVYETAEEMENRPRSQRVDLIRDRVLRHSPA